MASATHSTFNDQNNATEQHRPTAFPSNPLTPDTETSKNPRTSVADEISVGRRNNNIDIDAIDCGCWLIPSTCGRIGKRHLSTVFPITDDGFHLGSGSLSPFLSPMHANRRYRRQHAQWKWSRKDARPVGQTSSKRPFHDKNRRGSRDTATHSAPQVGDSEDTGHDTDSQESDDDAESSSDASSPTEESASLLPPKSKTEKQSIIHDDQPVGPASILLQTNTGSFRHRHANAPRSNLRVLTTVRRHQATTSRLTSITLPSLPPSSDNTSGPGQVSPLRISASESQLNGIVYIASPESEQDPGPSSNQPRRRHSHRYHNLTTNRLQPPESVPRLNEINWQSQTSRKSRLSLSIDEWKNTLTKSITDIRRMIDNVAWRKQNEQLIQTKQTGSNERLRVYIVTWNMNCRSPQGDLSALFGRPGDPQDHDSESSRRHYDACHIIAVAVQECQRGVETNILRREWERMLNRYFGVAYKVVEVEVLVGIHLAVFARRDIMKRISAVSSSRIATGIGNVLGNKGSVAIGLKFDKISMLFVCSHFAAHQHKVAARNRDFERADTEMTVPGYGTHRKRTSKRKSKSTTRLSDRFDYVFWAGDLNYRVNGTRAVVDALMAQNRLEVLLNNDQLGIEMRRGAVFHGFNEGPITFLPTYKFAVDESLSASRRRRKQEDSPSVTVSVPSQSTPTKTSSPQSMHSAVDAVLPMIISPIDLKPTSSLSHLPTITTPPSISHLGYDNREGKNRIPSWTDRILFKSSGKHRSSPLPASPEQTTVVPIVAEMYTSCPEIASSDHKPVHGIFALDYIIKTKKRAA